MRKLEGLILMGLLTFLSACAGPKLDHYRNEQPALTLEDYFSGPIKAWGLVQNRKGEVTARFDVDMTGTWDGNTGTLKEQFKYYDGKTQQRTWTIKKLNDKHYEGSAGDIIGKADGHVAGNAMRWAYEMDLAVGDKNYRIIFDDWMFLMNDGVLINRSYLKKFGFTVAELTLFMQKH